MTQTLASLQSMAAQTTGEVWHALITVSHDDIATLYLVSNPTAVVSNGSTFIPAWVDLVLEPHEPDQIGEASITLGAVDETILMTLDALTTPASVKVEIVIDSEPDNILKTIDGLALRQITTDLVVLKAKVEGPDFVNTIVPGILMNRVNTPALFL